MKHKSVTVTVENEVWCGINYEFEGALGYEVREEVRKGVELAVSEGVRDEVAFRLYWHEENPKG